MKSANKIISLILALCLFLSINVYSADEQETKEDLYYIQASERLSAFGIIGERDNIGYGDSVARDKFTEILISIALGDAPATDTCFDDVTKENPYSGYIKAACDMGVVSEGTQFNPAEDVTGEQAIKMILTMLGYESIAKSKGGYPMGYLLTGGDTGLTNGITSNLALPVTGRDLTVLLNNALEIPYTDINYVNGMINVDSESVRTLLFTCLDTIIVPAYIQETHPETDTITAVVDGKNQSYVVDSSIDVLEIAECDVRLYVRQSDDVVCYFTYDKNTSVVYDYIYSVNGDDEEGNPIAGWAIDEIELYNNEGEFEFADDAVFEFDGEVVTDAACNWVGSFARIVLYNDRISRIEAYPLTEGGLIYRAAPDMLKFTRGERTENIMTEVPAARSLQIFVNGQRQKDILDLKTDMVFDYWCNDLEDEFIIVASDRYASGVLEIISDETIELSDGSVYKISDDPGFYVYSDFIDMYRDENLATLERLRQLIGKNIIGYADDRGIVRYVRSFTSGKEVETEFDGIIMAGGYDGGGSIVTPKLRIFHLSGEKGVEKEYEISNKLPKTSISADYAISKAANINGEGIFHFKLNDKGVIRMIEPIEYFGNKIEVTSISRNSLIINDLIWLNAAVECAIFNDDGKFKAEIVHYINQNARRGIDTQNASSVTVVTDYNARYNPRPKYLIYANNVEYFRIADEQNGFISDTKYIPEENMYEIVVRHTMRGNNRYKVTEQFYKSNRLGKNMYITYWKGFVGSNPIKLINSIDLKQPSELWNCATYSPTATSGFFAADELLWCNGSAAQFVIDGQYTDPIALNSDIMACYEIVRKGNTIEILQPPSPSSPYADIEPGDKVWFNVINWYSPRMIDLILYEKAQ